MMVRACSPQGSEWPAEYRSYAVELHRRFQAGIISIGEMQTRLASKYPGYDIPSERTLRRWAREKYRDLPEQREQLLRGQGVEASRVQSTVLAIPQPFRTRPVEIPRAPAPSRIDELLRAITPFVVASTMLWLVALMSKQVVTEWVSD
jgi:hypothetical protein